MDDEAAIARLREGDIDALEPLVRRYQQRAMRAAYLITRDPALAEDIVQSAFLRAFERIHQLQSPAAFGGWFLRGVVNDATKAVSRNRTTPIDDDQGTLADPGLSPDELLAGVETRDELWAALATLPGPQRAAIVARYYLELSEAEFADHAQIPVGTVKWRLYAGRRRLRQLISNQPGIDARQSKEQSRQ
jgi:RNA polymerase sigma-70 factor (ECF subfamily)